MWDSDIGRSSKDERRTQRNLEIIGRCRWERKTELDLFDGTPELLSVETVFKGSKEDLTVLREALLEENMNYVTPIYRESDNEVTAVIAITGSGLAAFKAKFPQASKETGGSAGPTRG